jgi:hypothetical protein
MEKYCYLRESCEKRISVKREGLLVDDMLHTIASSSSKVKDEFVHKYSNDFKITNSSSRC